MIFSNTSLKFFTLLSFSIWQTFAIANDISPEIFDDPSDCTLTVIVPDDLTVCFDEEFSLNGVIIGDYDEFVWTENGSETNYDLDEDVSIGQTTTFTLSAFNINEENIIVNGDFEDGDSDFTTDYELGVMSCFGLGFLDCEGTYGVIDDPSDGHGNFSPCSDAVGGGNMLVVNGAASLQQIWCQEVCVEPGATYVFSSWATSVNPSSPAQLQFAIDGGLIGSLFSLSSSTCDWEEFEAEWTASSETTIEICVTNQNTAASGNDFAIDGVQFVRVCEDDASFTVTHSEFEVEFNDPVEITCEVTESEISIFTFPIGDYIYEWETSQGTITELIDDGQSIIVNQAGEYNVTITNELGCALEFEIEVDEEIDYPELEITSTNDLDCITPTSELEVDSDLNGIDFIWYDQEFNFLIEDNNIIIDEGGLYYVSAFDPDTGCESMDSIFIEENFDEIPFDIIPSNNLDCNNPTSTLSVSINFESIIWTNLTTNNILGNFNTININTPGLYTADLTFDNGCSANDSILITEVNPSFQYQIEFDSILDCNINTSTILIQIDTSQYDFQWQNQTITENTVFEYNTSQPGVYVYQITDSLNCTLIDSLTIIEDTTPPNIIINTDSLSCTNNTAILSIDNPLGNTTTEWTLPNGMLINNDSILISEPLSVNYTVTGQNGCTSSGEYEITSSEDIPIVSINANSINCTNPISTLTPITNSPDLIYEWTLPNGSNNEEIITTNSPGIFSLLITTPDGCQNSTSYEVLIDTISPEFNLPENLILDCNTTFLDGFLDITDTYENINSQGSWLDPISLSYFIDSPGTYNVEVVNKNGCSTSKNIEVDIDTLSPIISFENIQVIDCNSTGFDLEIKIENEYETLIWNGNIIANNELTQNIFSAGTYEVIAISTNGCESRKEVIIDSSDEAPQFNVTNSIIDCNNLESLINIEIISDYSELNIYDGNLLISNDLEFQTNTTPLTIEVIADNGCSTIETITIESDTTTIDFSLSAEVLTCDNTETLIEINSQINPNNISIFKVENGNIIPADFLVNSPGLYIVELENSNGCLSTQSITIEEVGDFPTIQFFNISSSICEEALTISNFEIEGGTPPYSMIVDSIQITDINESFVLEETGNHFIEITDTNGCKVDTTIIVDTIVPVTSSILPEVTINEGTDINLELTLNKPLDEIQIIDWSPKRDLTCYDCLNPIFIGKESTVYTIVVIDNNGCETEIETRVNIEINVRYFIPNVFSTSDNSANNAFTIYDNSKDIINIQFLNIYDRWGNLVFVNKNFLPNDPKLGWDGTFDNKRVEQGVYVYYSILEMRNGEFVKESGDVTFLR